MQLGGSKIVYISGGSPCGQFNDLTMAKNDIVPLLLSNEKVMADNGYRDPHFMTSIKNPVTAEELRYNRWNNLIQARHEHVNKRLKQFNILRNAFRHSHNFHPKVVLACANLTQIMLTTHPIMQAPMP